MLAAAQHGDVDAVRRLIEAGNLADIDERDQDNHQTPLMIAAYRGDLEVAWLLVDAGADTAGSDRGGATALMMAQQRGHDDIVALLGGATGRAEGVMIPDFSSEEEDEAPSLGTAVLLHHVAKLELKLAAFDWPGYEAALARLAGVSDACVFVTPEPGAQSIEAHTTVIKRLQVRQATSPEGIAEVMKTVKTMRQASAIQRAAGARHIGLIEVELCSREDQLKPLATELSTCREEYEQWREAFSSDAGGSGDALALAASKAILLLRPTREALKKAAAAESSRAPAASSARRGPPPRQR